MIEFKKAYVVGDTVYATLAEAQEQALIEFIGDDAAKRVMENADKVLDILTTKPTSKPRARAVHGGKKTRKAGATALNSELQDMKQ